MMVQIFLFSFSITNLIFDVRNFGFVIRKNSFINLFHKKPHFFVLSGQTWIYARRVFNPQATGSSPAPAIQKAYISKCEPIFFAIICDIVEEIKKLRTSSWQNQNFINSNSN